MTTKYPNLLRFDLSAEQIPTIVEEAIKKDRYSARFAIAALTRKGGSRWACDFWANVGSHAQGLSNIFYGFDFAVVLPRHKVLDSRF